MTAWVELLSSSEAPEGSTAWDHLNYCVQARDGLDPATHGLTAWTVLTTDSAAEAEATAWAHLITQNLCFVDTDTGRLVVDDHNVVIYSELYNASTQEDQRYITLTEMAYSLTNESLEFFVQPNIPLHTVIVHGYETLATMADSEYAVTIETDEGFITIL